MRNMRGKKCESGKSVAFNGYGNGGTKRVLPAAVGGSWYGRNVSSEKAVSGKSGRKKPENMLEALQCFLTARYDFRYNLLTEQTEYRGKEMPDEEYDIVLT